MSTAYIALSRDMNGDPVVYRDEDGKPVTHATREEAQASADEDVAEWARQVADGDRDADDVPDADEVLEGTLKEDGSFTGTDGTYVEAKDNNGKMFLFADGSGRGVRTQMTAMHIRKHWTPDEEEELEAFNEFLNNAQVGETYDADIADHFVRIL